LSYLFIDSTYDLTLGVLDDGLNWLTLEKLTNLKASAVIQAKAHELLKKHSINPTELSGIITVNGPGFYTGLRLAEGFSDVFKFFGVNQYSFYSYEVPLWCGYTKGVWFTKAYRGEYFFYRWDNQKSDQKLVGAKELNSEITSEKFFIHSEASLDTLSSSLISDREMTSELIKNHSQKIFNEVLKGPSREPFYFRAPEDEFKANP
jgi:tRNA threonylcarbamoyladenosine biosynthesis protein TsaB